MNTTVLEKQADDLTVIKGIGSVRQAWLQTHLGVATFADLATLSAEEIAEALRADNRIAALDSIEDWLAAAQELADERGEETAVSHPNSSRFETWQPFASFVLEFQERKLPGQPKEQRTKVHYMETDTETVWDGLAHADLSDWVRQQVGESVLSPEPVVVRAERPSLTTEPVRIEVERLVAWQPAKSATPQLVYEAERPLTGYLLADCPFTATIALALSAAPQAENSFAAELHARDLSSGKNVMLPLLVERAEVGVTAVLEEGCLPTGLYRFALLMKQSHPRNFQFIELPRFQVV